MFGFCLGAYYGFVLGFLGATCWRHWISLYDGPTPRIHKEPDHGVLSGCRHDDGYCAQPHWSRNGP